MPSLSSWAEFTESKDLAGETFYNTPTDRPFDYAQGDRDSMNLKPSNILTPTSNNSYFYISSLFHQRIMLCEGYFIAYLCDTKVGWWGKAQSG